MIRKRQELRSPSLGAVAPAAGDRKWYGRLNCYVLLVSYVSDRHWIARREDTKFVFTNFSQEWSRLPNSEEVERAEASEQKGIEAPLRGVGGEDSEESSSHWISVEDGDAGKPTPPSEDL